MQSFNNLIQIPLTPEMADYWSSTAIADLIFNNYLNLRVRRNDYTLITEGKGLKTEMGYKGVYADRSFKRLGFRVQVRSQSEDLYLALLEIANGTGGNGCDLNPIEILDYCHFHDRADRDRGYRIRKGVFQGEFSSVGGVATMGFIDCQSRGEIVTGARYGNGFSFKFMETSPSYSYF